MRVRTLVLALAVALPRFVHGSDLYPGLVSLERTDSTTFVSEPNILENVTKLKINTVAPNPRPKKENFIRLRSLPKTKLDCVDNARDKQFTLKSVRRDLPGTFRCDNKFLYVYPEVEVEIDRFFNVSLDFLKLRSSTPIEVEPTVPYGISFEIGPSTGVVFVSGIVTRPGTLFFALEFLSSENKVLYKLRVMLLLKKNENRADGMALEFRLPPKETAKDLNLTVIQKQIRAIKCAAESLAVSPTSFHGLNPEREFVESSTLRAHASFAGNVCAPGAPGSEATACSDFIIDETTFSKMKCREVVRDPPVGDPGVDSETDSTETEENTDDETGYVSDVKIQDGEIITLSPPIATEAPKTEISSGTTETVGQAVTPATETPRTPEIKETVDRSGDEPWNEVDSRDPALHILPMKPVLLHDGILKQTQDDTNLKTALYGMLSLSAIAISVIFVFLFSKLELCTKKTGYDPVFVARHSDESPKFG
ncbi:uncharacterized protein LOC100899173 [Galendromus occidentalis]|uniref:Uncharacterized protein LOC100899173 n=1 Tax=Galendromus occidentalis TaxID=34638 RepID=A0AAJ6QNJ3_9ACAR|nr:uncharacterized protein LOC100899173 [Galendromus occidentalis]